MSKPPPLLYGETYHIYNRGNNGENLFYEARNYPYFLMLYAKHIEPIAETFAYCLLGNHFHLLVRIRSEEGQDLTRLQDLTGIRDQTRLQDLTGIRDQTRLQDLTGFQNLSGLRTKPLDPSQQFSNLFNSYTKSINQSYGRTGNLFQRPFGRIQVTTDEYFAQLIHYIHFNSQKHGFVGDFREYPYSSYDVLCSDKSTQLKRDQVMDRFNGKHNFEMLHQAPPDEKQLAGLIGDDY